MTAIGRLILTASALIFFTAAIAAIFAPDELARLLEPDGSRGLALAIQLVGSGLFGFACLDWMSRGNRIGGIYGRPVAMANLALCTTAALALGKAAAGTHGGPAVIALALVFGSLAMAFAWLAFVHDPFD